MSTYRNIVTLVHLLQNTRLRFPVPLACQARILSTLDSKEALMPLNVTWEREDSTLGGQLGDKATSNHATQRQAVLDLAIGRRPGPVSES